MTPAELMPSLGRMHIRNITSALHMREALRSAGEQVFRLAAANNFIQGRRLKGVAAVALYIACRSQAKEEPNQFMLIDFADVLEVRHSWNFLVRSVC